MKMKFEDYDRLRDEENRVACRHEFIARNIPVDALDDCRYDVMSRTEELACDVCKSHWGRYTSPDDLNAAVAAIAKAVAEKCAKEEQ